MTDHLGHYLGKVLALAVSPAYTEDRVCFAATNQGLYATTDGGRSWQNVFNPAKDGTVIASVTAVAIAPNFAQDNTLLAGLYGGILHSTNRGSSWHSVWQRSPPPLVTDILFHSSSDGRQTVVAATLGDGVFLSDDEGRHWSAGNFGLLDPNVLCLASAPLNNQLFAGVESGLFRSHNGGRTWTETAFPSDLAPLLALEVTAFGAGEMIWAGTERHGLWASADNGRTWNHKGAEHVQAPVNALQSLGNDSPAVLIASGQALYVTDDKDTTWLPVAMDSALPASILTIAVVPEVDQLEGRDIFVGLRGDGLRQFLLTTVDKHITLA